MLEATLCGNRDVGLFRSRLGCNLRPSPILSQVASAPGQSLAPGFELYGFARISTIYFPVQRGFRFSRNELTPSRKSAVLRMRAFSSTAAAISRSRFSEA